ncbi:hypothetical protein ACWGS9_26315 [Bradyrhizobium sp. Arg314]
MRFECCDQLGMRQGRGATLAIMAVAAIYYLLFPSRRANWTLHGPDELAG